MDRDCSALFRILCGSWKSKDSTDHWMNSLTVTLDAKYTPKLILWLQAYLKHMTAMIPNLGTQT